MRNHGVGNRVGCIRGATTAPRFDPLTIMGCFNCDDPKHEIKNCPKPNGVARRNAKAYGDKIVAPSLMALRYRGHAWPMHECDAELPPCTGHGRRGEHSAS